MKLTREQKTFVEELLSSMTLDEKLGQMNLAFPCPGDGIAAPGRELGELPCAGRISRDSSDKIMAGAALPICEEDIRAGLVGGVIACDPHINSELQRIAVEESRLGIPLLIGSDLNHGFRSVFPVPLAESCSFDDDLFEITAHMAALESRIHGINWIFSPTLDAALAAHLGRVSEGSGEDPLLVSRFARAKIRGLQNDHSRPFSFVAACAGFDAANSGPESDRDDRMPSVSGAVFYKLCLPAIRAAVEEDAATILSAFNGPDSALYSGSSRSLRDLLKGDLGFDGFMVGDVNSVRGCGAHSTAADDRSAALQAVLSGIDMDLGSGIYGHCLKREVDCGTLPTEIIDEAVRRILSLKVWLGLFDNPCARDELIKAYDHALPDAHVGICRRAAEESMVLLKNTGDVLPLNRGQKISLVGRLADDSNEVCGPFSMARNAEDCVSIRAGLEAAGAQLDYYQCGGPDGEPDPDEIERACRGCDVIVAVVGESCSMSREASFGTERTLPGRQRELLECLLASGKPVVAVLMNSRPLALDWEAEHLPAILEAWQLGIRMGDAVAAVLLGDVSPSGKLSVSFPPLPGHCPACCGRPDASRTGIDTDVPAEALFPFGHGLSYTGFVYRDMQIHRIGECLEITARLCNTGDHLGTEVAQLYVQNVSASPFRPLKELRDYRRIELRPGEEKKLIFILPLDKLGFYDNDGLYCLEDGLFRFFIGGSSRGGLSRDIKIVFNRAG